METKELYERLCQMEGVTGDISYADKMITWRFHENLCIEAYSEEGDTYIGVENQNYHYHPNEDAMFNELLDINSGLTVFVSKIGIFGRYISFGCKRTFYEKHRIWIRLGIGAKVFSSQGVVK